MRVAEREGDDRSILSAAWDFDASGYPRLFDDTQGLLPPHRIITREEQQSMRLPVRKQLDPRTFRVKVTSSVVLYLSSFEIVDIRIV
jgi:hypothetical protein